MYYSWLWNYESYVLYTWCVNLTFNSSEINYHIDGFIILLLNIFDVQKTGRHKHFYNTLKNYFTDIEYIFNTEKITARLFSVNLKIVLLVQQLNSFCLFRNKNEKTERHVFSNNKIKNLWAFTTKVLNCYHCSRCVNFRIWIWKWF